MFLELFPKISNYDLTGTTGGMLVDLGDVFRRVRFSKTTLSNHRLYVDYMIKDGESPEDVAMDFYGGSRWFWLVLMSNDLIDPIGEWPKSSSQLQRQLNDVLHFGGKSYFINDIKDFKVNDVIAKSEVCTMGDEGCPDGITSSMENYAIIDDWDSNFFRIDSSRIVGSLNEDDYITIFRENDSGKIDMISGSTACTSNIFQSQIKKSIDTKKSVSAFYQGGFVVNPYGSTGDISDINYPNGNTGGLCDSTDSVLYHYINGLDYSPVESETIENKLLTENDSKRQIKLIHPHFKEKIFKEIKKLIQTPGQRGKTVFVEIG